MTTGIMTYIEVLGRVNVFNLVNTEYKLCKNLNILAVSESVSVRDRLSNTIESIKESNSNRSYAVFRMSENSLESTNRIFVGNVAEGGFRIFTDSSLLGKVGSEIYNYSKGIDVVLKDVIGKVKIEVADCSTTKNVVQSSVSSQVLSSSDWNSSLVVGAITLVALGALGIVLARACFGGSVKDSETKEIHSK